MQCHCDLGSTKSEFAAQEIKSDIKDYVATSGLFWWSYTSLPILYLYSCIDALLSYKMTVKVSLVISCIILIVWCVPLLCRHKASQAAESYRWRQFWYSLQSCMERMFGGCQGHASWPGNRKGYEWSREVQVSHITHPVEWLLISKVIIWRQLQHPNIVQVMGMDKLPETDKLAILMTLVDGHNLHHVIFQGRKQQVPIYVIIHFWGEQVAFLFLRWTLETRCT